MNNKIYKSNYDSIPQFFDHSLTIIFSIIFVVLFQQKFVLNFQNSSHIFLYKRFDVHQLLVIYELQVIKTMEH